MVQVVGVGPDLVTIKSRVHNRFATPANIGSLSTLTVVGLPTYPRLW